MVKSSPELDEGLRINYSSSGVYWDQMNSEYVAISSEHDSQEGQNAHGIMVDELHV